MDPRAVNTAMDQIEHLCETGNIPNSDFAVAQIEGLIAKTFGIDTPTRVVVGALAALEVQRKNNREWDHATLEDVPARRAQERESRGDTGLQPT